MRGGNAGFILRGVYRMQCAYHSSSWTRSSIRVPVGWTCWHGCLFWVRTAAYISKVNRRTCWASPALNLKHMHVYTACGPNQWCAPQKRLSGGHMASGRLCITKGWQTEASCQICPDLNFSTIATLSWELINSPGMVKNNPNSNANH